MLAVTFEHLNQQFTSACMGCLFMYDSYFCMGAYNCDVVIKIGAFMHASFVHVPTIQISQYMLQVVSSDKF